MPSGEIRRLLVANWLTHHPLRFKYGGVHKHLIHVIHKPATNIVPGAQMANYKAQISLLLSILSEVAKETCFALHGGTAINLFVREMPRLSVDINLTYVPLEDRQISLLSGSVAL